MGSGQKHLSKPSCVWFHCCYMLYRRHLNREMCLLMMNQVLIAAGTGLDSKLHLHVCLHAAQTVCVYKLCSCRHTLAPLLCLPQTRAPSPFLLYLLTTATTNMQAGRRLTHLDYPPPTHQLSCHISSRSVVSPSSLLTWPFDSLAVPLPLSFASPHLHQHILLIIQTFLRQVVVCCCFYVLIRMMAMRRPGEVLSCKKKKKDFFSLVNI